MENKGSAMSSIRRSIQKKREEINLADFSLTEASYLAPGQTFPLVVQPSIAGVNLVSWAANNQEYIRKELAKHGAILFRNFTVDSASKFEGFARAVSADGELFDEYGDLPRDMPGAKVYHSTPYPADKSILFHNESSHTHRWPMKIFFYCVAVAGKGGATPIIDCRKTYQLLDPAIIQRMADKKLMYVRNFIKGLDVSWQQFFQTTEKERVEDYCRKAGIDFEWKSEDHLTTRQICQAVAKHPFTGEMLFFNQIQLHHVYCLDPEIRSSMLSMFREEDLPRNVYYGDGTLIEDSVVAEIGELYEQQAVRFQWQAGDVILLDNMMVAHSRDPFEGSRKILVAMAEVINQ
ncbi:MAG TPA: TauD/TfdA family dioxygenase [Ktedonobacteraceae bacterium]|jgi:alpha-ketoglutarate-dependent taurine dioxygenase|nr:TauD/TfdA family dioxygenase [Ktedonobacteraceae bacterium]